LRVIETTVADWWQRIGSESRALTSSLAQSHAGASPGLHHCPSTCLLAGEANARLAHCHMSCGSISALQHPLARVRGLPVLTTQEVGGIGDGWTDRDVDGWWWRPPASHVKRVAFGCLVGIVVSWISGLG
jgi:hypothetical protein